MLPLGAEQAALDPTPWRRGLLSKLGELHFGVRLRGHYLARALQPLPTPPTVLDVGCSRGQMSFWLAHRFPQAQVVGLDIDPALIAHCEQLARVCPTPNLRFCAADLATHLPTQPYALIVCFDVLEHIEDWQTAVATLARWLRPGGHLLLHTPQAGPFQSPQFGLRRWVRPAHLPAHSAEHVRAGFSANDFAYLNTLGLSIQVQNTFGPTAMWLHTVFEAYRDHAWAWRILLTLPLLRLAAFSELHPPQQGGGLLVLAHKS